MAPSVDDIIQIDPPMEFGYSGLEYVAIAWASALLLLYLLTVFQAWRQNRRRKKLSDARSAALKQLELAHNSAEKSEPTGPMPAISMANMSGEVVAEMQNRLDAIRNASRARAGANPDSAVSSDIRKARKRLHAKGMKRIRRKPVEAMNVTADGAVSADEGALSDDEKDAPIFIRKQATRVGAFADFFGSAAGQAVEAQLFEPPPEETPDPDARPAGHRRNGSSDSVIPVTGDDPSGPRMEALKMGDNSDAADAAIEAEIAKEIEMVRTPSLADMSGDLAEAKWMTGLMGLNRAKTATFSKSKTLRRKIAKFSKVSRMFGGKRVNLDGDEEDDTPGQPQMQINLSWDNVNLAGSRGPILCRLTGQVKAGEMVAIMGPSGCGKTTLLNMLAGRTNQMPDDWVRSGRIALNGRDTSDVILKDHIAYVQQDDVFYPLMTVNEVMQFAARLKLSHDDFANSQKIIDDTLERLDLSKTKNNNIGDNKNKGISGGQKRRLSIGIELITLPRILLLDEVTSGLDAVAAFTVCQMLRDLADAGCIVISTIHQPSSDVFRQFDKLYLLKDGFNLYDGKLYDKETGNCDMLDYWDERGFPAQPDTNPADFVLFLVQDWEEDVFCEQITKFEEDNEDKHAQISANIEWVPDGGNLAKSYTEPHRAKFLIQVKSLLMRRIKLKLRGRFENFLRITLPFFFFFLQAILAEGAGKPVEGEFKVNGIYVPVVMRNYFIVWASIGIGGFGTSIFCASNQILDSPIEPEIRKREIQSHMYQPAAYYLSRFLVEFPFMTLIFAGATFVPRALLPYEIAWYYIFGVQALNVFAILGISWLVSTAFEDPPVALQISNLFVIPQLLYVGLLVPVHLIPSWLRWAEILCFVKHSTDIFAMLDFGNDLVAQQLFKDQYAYPNEFYTSIFAILAIGSVAFVGAVELLRSKVSGEGPEKVNQGDYDRRTERVIGDMGTASQTMKDHYSPSAKRKQSAARKIN